MCSAGSRTSLHQRGRLGETRFVKRDPFRQRWQCAFGSSPAPSMESRGCGAGVCSLSAAHRYWQRPGKTLRRLASAWIAASPRQALCPSVLSSGRRPPLRAQQKLGSRSKSRNCFEMLWLSFQKSWQLIPGNSVCGVCKFYPFVIGDFDLREVI